VKSALAGSNFSFEPTTVFQTVAFVMFRPKTRRPAMVTWAHFLKEAENPTHGDGLHCASIGNAEPGKYNRERFSTALSGYTPGEVPAARFRQRSTIISLTAAFQSVTVAHVSLSVTVSSILITGAVRLWTFPGGCD
jgi:hypothetical protein